MLKNIFGIVLGLLMFASPGVLKAQDNPMMQPLPLMPNVKTGVLPNGLTYYIMHNEEPKGRANFYIAQKVGSTLENESQLGLAHFLEHMAFNGTQNYPGKKMLNYLQSKSLRFGTDINAYTGFDETVYNVDNVPTSDKALMDSVLLVLRDWGCAISLEGEEIDAERNVIQEEWRSRNNASTRYFMALLPQVYKEYQYHQMPIGKMEVVMNFPHDDLRAYYRKWYRPDQQGIIIVGDFDADEMEAKVKALFGAIEMPADAAPRLYPEVSDNKEPIYFEFADPEAPQSVVEIMFKKENTPFAERNTLVWWCEDVINDIVTNMIDNRLQEFAEQPECEYSSAGVYFGNFLVSKTKDAFNITVEPKVNFPKATQQAMEIVARACKTGFSESEFQRAKDEMRSRLERRFNERTKTQNGQIARQLIRHFVDNNALAGPEADLQLFDAIMGKLPLDAINGLVKEELLTAENQVMLVFMPQKEGMSLPGKEAMLGVLNAALGKTYEAYQDEVINEPLIAKMPKPGKITKSYNNQTYGTTEFTLSNGARVILKSTDFAADEIRFTCVSNNGGWQLFNPSNPQDVSNFAMIETAVNASKVGNFTNSMMRKYLSGKQVGVGFNMTEKTTGLRGFSVKKDINTLMELIYSNFTQLNPDPEQYAVELQKVCTKIEQSKNDPTKSFSDSLQLAMYNGDMRLSVDTAEKCSAANYAQILKMTKGMFANAADFTFIFVGNVDEATLRPLLEQYIASLPSKKKASKPAKIYPASLYTGTKTIAFEKPMNTPSTIYYSFTSGGIEINSQSDVNVDIAGEILGNLFTEIIREKEGAAYSPAAVGNLNTGHSRWQMIRVIQTNSEKQEKAFGLSDEELNKVLNGEITESQFNDVKGAAINQYDISLRKNNFWMSTLNNYVLGYDTFIGHKEALQNLTLDSFKAWLRSLKAENCLTVIMTGVPEKK